MATNDFVPKSELFAQLRSVFNNKESGMITVLTETKKSVLMRFSEGELTSARCRNWDVEHTISALLETDRVKYSYMSSAGEDKDALIAASDFMMMIDPGGSGLESEEVLSAKSAADNETESVIPAEVEKKAAEDKAAEAAQEDIEQAGKDIDRAIAAKMNYF